MGLVQLLLTWPEHAPRADCKDGLALVAAATGGHEKVVRLLLAWPCHAPGAACQDGLASREAANGRYEGVVRLLRDATV